MFLPWGIGNEYVLYGFSLAIMTVGMVGAAKLWLMIRGLTWNRLPDVFIGLAIYWGGVSFALFWPDEYWNIFLSLIQCLVYFFTMRYFLGRKDTV